MSIDIDFDVALINPAHRWILTATQSEIIVYGGSSSGKTYSLAQCCVLWALEGRSILVVRQVAKTLRTSVFSDIKKIIYSYGLQDLFIIRVSTMEIISKYGDGCIMFCGLDDVEKVKGVTPAKAAAFDTLWKEEATETLEEVYNQLMLRMRGKTRFVKRRILSFNPIYMLHWIYKKWFAHLTPSQQISYTSESIRIQRSTFLDNEYLEDDEKLVFEQMKKNSPYHYKVYALGEFGVIGSLIYENWEVCKHPSQRFINSIPEMYFGGDWGYNPDPYSCVKVGVNMALMEIYVLGERGGLNRHTKTIAKEIKPLVGNNMVNWDSARPDLIDEVRDYGINAEPANKRLLKKRAIVSLQMFTIYISEECPNFKQEIEVHQRKKNAQGEYLPEAADGNDHYLDAWVYALQDTINNAKYCKLY
ncbi:MAG: PBSX family phage terminase large subunit [Desulfobulbaceae bacterium]|nr:PBSX family phage terminase large subunit [Desulfobulbaceae bacterium]